METKREERTEYVGMYLTKEMAKQLKEAGDNEVLKDKILKQFVTNETDWLKDEVQQMDEITTIYRAKLLTIRDNFAKVQDVYIEEIENLLENTAEAVKPIGNLIKPIQSEIEGLKNQVEIVSKSISNLKESIKYVDFSNVEKLLNVIDRFNQMGESEKELIRLLVAQS